MSPEALERDLRDAVTAGVFPGVQVHIVSGGRETALTAGVTMSGTAGEAVSPHTIYDVASLTKAISTSVLLMAAVQEGDLSLQTPVERWFPSLAAADRITVGLLASHRSGLPAYCPYYRQLVDEGIAGASEARERLESLIVETPLESAPDTATRYSDIGYILLGWILERVHGMALDAQFQSRIGGPLRLVRTSFGPIDPSSVAPTELDERGELLCGVVHDENARAIGGIAGHAGLFSTASEVARVVRHLEAARRGAGGVVSTEVVRRFWAPIAGGAFTLGWDTPTEPSSSGRFTTRGSTVGHLGFTGCSVWHDWARDATIVVLSNRVHPTRQNTAIRSFRPAFHEAVYRSLGVNHGGRGEGPSA